MFSCHTDTNFIAFENRFLKTSSALGFCTWFKCCELACAAQQHCTAAGSEPGWFGLKPSHLACNEEWLVVFYLINPHALLPTMEVRHCSTAAGSKLGLFVLQPSHLACNVQTLCWSILTLWLQQRRLHGNACAALQRARPGWFASQSSHPAPNMQSLVKSRLHFTATCCRCCSGCAALQPVTSQVGSRQNHPTWLTTYDFICSVCTCMCNTAILQPCSR